jgi:protein phosphatase
VSEPTLTSVSGQRLVIDAVLKTDVGLVRSENQDFGTLTADGEEKDSRPGGRLFIVADGMGGHRGGATASRLAVETVKSQYLGSESDDVASSLRQALSRANARVFAEAQSNPDLRGMGTTTSVLAARQHQAWLAHVGDSRIYLVRGDSIKQLTDDHSLVATMVREGLLTSQEAETHPRRNVLQRSIGVAEDVDVDVRGPIDLQAGDVFILCSDGLHGLVKEAELKEIAAKPVQEAADAYVKAALDRGAPDNVTVIVARVTSVPEPVASEELLEQTQKIEPVDASQFDETVKESERTTEKIPVLNDETETGGKQEPAEVPEPRGGGRSIVTWILVLIVALAAAGAWVVWNHQQASATEAATSSP